MSNLFIKVETLAGTSIEDAVKEGIELANKLDTPISIRHNGIGIMLYKDSNPYEEVKDYYERINQSSLCENCDKPIPCSMECQKDGK